MVNKRVLVLLSFVFCLLISHLLGYVGHFGYDDMQYAAIAHAIREGNFPAEDHFAYRFAVVLPTALFYLLFGVNDWASSLPAMLASMVILFFIYQMLKREAFTTLIIALGFTLFSHWYLFYSDKLMPDIHLCMGIIGAVYFYYRQRFQFPSASKGNALGFTVLLFYAFLAKGTVILSLPLFAYFLLLDLWQKRNRQFWLFVLIGMVFLSFFYFVLIYLLTGDMSSRFEALFANSYLNRCSYAEQSSRILLKRLSVDFLRMLRIDTLLYTFSIIALVALFEIRKGLFRLTTPLHFFLMSSLLMLAASNFMSISPTSYNPMCLDIRHYLYLIPLSGIAAGIYLQQAQRFGWRNLLLIISLLIISVLSYRNEDQAFNWYYLPVGIGLSLFLLSSFYQKYKPLALSLLILTLAYLPYQLTLNARDLQYQRQKEFVRAQLLADNQPKIIISDPVMANIGPYWNEFRENGLAFYAYDDSTVYEVSRKPTYLLQNWHTRFQSFHQEGDYPFYVKQTLEQQPLATDSIIGASIYRVNELIDPEKEGKLIWSMKNDFEGAVETWSGRSDILTTEKQFAGKQSNIIYEYSATLLLPLDSLIDSSLSYLIIRVKGQVFTEESTLLKLVVSLDNPEANYLWQGKSVEGMLKTFAHWWPVNMEQVIPLHAIQPNTNLKIYLWSVEKRRVYLDELEVKIIGI
jgi:4-amino-4-deoxy-L-arabinose transferase-like glycosyltransferase